MITVAATLLIVLGLIYGIGYLCFAWWDGGVARRLLIALAGLALIYGVLNYLQMHRLKF